MIHIILDFFFDFHLILFNFDLPFVHLDIEFFLIIHEMINLFEHNLLSYTQLFPGLPTRNGGFV